MKLLFDENFEKSAVDYFRKLGYDVVYVGGDEYGINDKSILKRALREERILITNDLDFGRLVFQQLRGHAGVVLFRLADQAIETKIRVLKLLFSIHGEKLHKTFTVIDEQGVRMRSK